MTNAGFTITSFIRTYNGGDFSEGVALGEKARSFGMEYVTWAYTKRGEAVDFYWGHYFTDAQTAQDDMIDRARR